MVGKQTTRPLFIDNVVCHNELGLPYYSVYDYNAQMIGWIPYFLAFSLVIGFLVGISFKLWITRIDQEK
jgi:hypothetical protein